MTSKPVYLDCNATTPIEPEVWAIVRHYFETEFGNEGSRTHEFGTRAKQAVQKARDQIATTVKSQRDEVIFTSGATESNNLALLGLAHAGTETGRRHIVSTAIEHKAVLEPLEELEKRGFQVTLIPSGKGGRVDPHQVLEAIRPDTLFVSVMHANNETGIIQPIEEISDLLMNHSAYLHVDAAQTFGKLIEPLQNPRIDLISLSAHKIYGPKGVGALVARRRAYQKIPLCPVTFGGGQERGLRPGTLPVPLIAGLGAAAELGLSRHHDRAKACMKFRSSLGKAIFPLGAIVHGDQDKCLPHVINLSFPGIDSEALIVALKSLIALSNGSACTSASYKPSHVLEAMGLSSEDIAGAIRFSWCHTTPAVDWSEVAARITQLAPFKGIRGSRTRQINQK
jgi:cysteine desulfurase